MQPQEILDFIKSRRSMGNLIAPAPTQTEVEQAIEVAMTAPDHKGLQPYRFVVLQGNALTDFGKALHQASLDQGETDPATLAKALAMPHRSPMIITVISHYREHEKVPHWEQLACASSATQNLLLALQAIGYATVWRTGNLIDTQPVKDYFNVTDKNQIVGFVYVGTAGAELPKRPPMLVDDFIDYRA
ncbi:MULTISPECIES: nitroreductase family protein [unclassified Moraxella]|uniref:nitroreductase family protein n=1 Tax=unclassified Moraxella TaxID=2685852 RepID=UPI003AF82EBE